MDQSESTDSYEVEEPEDSKVEDDEQLVLRDVLFSDEAEEEVYKRREAYFGVVGMINLGNTCYMNAAIQALAHVPAFRNFFLLFSGGPRLRNLKSPTNVIVSLAFRDLLMKLWTNPNMSLRPTVFMFRIREKCAQFRGFGQQDAQEFIRCFLDVIHNELKYEVPTEPALPCSSASSNASNASTDEENGDSGMSTENESNTSRKQSESEEPEKAVELVDKAKKPNYESVVNVIFDGRLTSTVRCLTCQHLSETKEAFQDISLSIPTTEQLDKMREAIEEMEGKRIEPSEPGYAYWILDVTARWFIYPWFSWISNFYNYLFYESITLEDCLRGFFAADHLRGEDMYKCEKCNKLRNGVKQCCIDILPQILCIHLKRFRHDSLYNSKINTKVVYPLRNLDLNPFMETSEHDGNDYVYDLVSIVSHRGGSVDFGHYVAYALNDIDDKWYEYDDSYVRPISEAELEHVEAYVLFYKRRPVFQDEPMELDG